MSHPAEPTIVFVHGAWCGPWIWNITRDYLPDVPTVAVDLPSAGRDPAKLGDLYADAAVLREAVRAIDGPVVVVAHSYGGLVATQALAGCANVRQIIYVSAVVPDADESGFELFGEQFPVWMEIVHQAGRARGRDARVWHRNREAAATVHVEASDPSVLFSDADPCTRAAAVSQLVPQSLVSIFDEIDTLPAWQDIPSTYVLCTRDTALHPAAQAVYSARCDQVRHLQADHSPMVSQPAELALLLRREISDPDGEDGE